MMIWKRTPQTLGSFCLVALLGSTLRAGEPDSDYEWENVTMNAAFAPRDGAGALVFKDRMWVLEGWNKQNRNDVWYSADGVNWHEVPDTPWRPRHAASVFVFNNAQWMVAGNNMQSDVWKLTRTTTIQP